MNGKTAKDMRRKAAQVVADMTNKPMEQTAHALGKVVQAVRIHDKQLRDHATVIETHGGVLGRGLRGRLRWLLRGK